MEKGVQQSLGKAGARCIEKSLASKKKQSSEKGKNRWAAERGRKPKREREMRETHTQPINGPDLEFGAHRSGSAGLVPS